MFSSRKQGNKYVQNILLAPNSNKSDNVKQPQPQRKHGQ